MPEESATQTAHIKKIEKIKVLIPSRAGSKRVKDKNIRLLGRHPLLAYSIFAARECQLPAYVSTDSAEYAAIARDYGANVLMRSAELASDNATDLDVIEHFLANEHCDLVVYLRPTTPFRLPDMILEAVEIMSGTAYDSLRSVEEMDETAYKCFTITAGILRPLTPIDITDAPNQSLQPTFKPNGYVDIVRSDIVKRGALWGSGRYAFITPKTVEIDTEDDFEYAEYLINHKKRSFDYGKD